ncbi:putative beta-barrel porin [Dyadobacter jejuensis]|uniref:Putative beta-barrel porin n=1 Tax=Dyadobacter jejuensis TaxID=1082580 RepID=A0A316AHZ3_9BACT|nr:putative porin [Dyadobacter jejuensis]PWJ57322.1 putative beta-barrel porin [Dyadobacter jejuensis]
MKLKLVLIVVLMALLASNQWAMAQINLPAGLPMPGGSAGGGGSQGGGGGGAALLDDSTKNIYGPKTTVHFFEKDILNNRDSVRYRVDTSLTNFQRWTPIDKSWGTLMDLGNVATASNPIFFQPRSDIGKQLGMRAYDAYAIKPDEVYYYNTKSQHTDLTFVSGAKKTSMGRFGYTQNFGPRLNIGIKAQRLTSNKQYGTYSSVNSEALLGQNWTFLAQGSYFSKNTKYLILAHYRHLNQKVREQGGVIPDTSEGGDGIYTYDGDARISDDANSWERRHGFHIYQQYRLVNGFQIFQQADYQSTINRYTDLALTKGISNGIYRNVYADSTYTRQDLFHKLFDNKFGIKGVFSGFNYRAYVRQRLYGLKTDSQVTNTEGSPYTRYRTGLKFENMLGLWLGYYFKDSTQYLTAEGEHLIGKDLKLKGEITTKWAKAGYQTILWSPDMLMDFYSSNNLSWKNDFKMEWVNTIYGSIPIKTERVHFEPEMQYHLIRQHMYYDQEAAPQQYGGTINLFRIGATADIQLNRWNLSARTYYTLNDTKSIIRNPDFYASGQVTFDFVYYQALYVQLGLSANYRSSYSAYAYMPLTQQFHLPNGLYSEQQTREYFVTDAFANLRIKRVRLFLKYSYLNMDLWGLFPAGSYQSPGYLDIPRSFSFGIVWPMFD